MPVILESITSHPNDEENDVASSKPRFARSPHPYHRHSLELPDRYYPDDVTIQKNQARLPLSGPEVPLTFEVSRRLNLEYFDLDFPNRRKRSTSPSDSGTEANDERGGLLKGLPAPPVRPRKGLKVPSNLKNGTSPSPLLTPSYIDAEKQKLLLEREFKHQGGAKKAMDDENLNVIKEKLTRRRRAEFIRRLSETAWLIIVGCLSCRGAGIDFTLLGSRSRSFVPLKGNILSPQSTPVELLSYGLLVAIIYFTYPISLLLYHGFNGLQIPAAFDPAPLLYPVLLPVFIATSLSSNNPRLLLPNLILSACSIPLQMIPFKSYYSNSIHWLCSLLPLLMSNYPHAVSWQLPRVSLEAPIHSRGIIDAEILVLLPHLHQSLVPTLRFLTTTSLLPAELQLLSVAMINVLLFSSSPQAVILGALLWIGGLSIFISCRHVLKWAVSIARIPSWRFRQHRVRSKQVNTLLSAISDYLGGRFKTWHLYRNGQGDSEDDEVSYLPIRDVHKKFSGNIELEKRDPAKLILAADIVATEQPLDDKVCCGLNCTDGNHASAVAGRNRYRRHTLPAQLEADADRYTLKKSKPSSRNRLRSQIDRPKFFLSLTVAQARVLKWVYACWVYLMVIFTIVLLIRLYIRKWSLQGNEPVGWALGYLFGDLPFFRLWTVMNNLEQWICLPPRDYVPSTTNGLADTLRLERIGAANIRLLICAYCVATIAVGLFVVLRLSTIAEVDTRRKVFHGMMVAMFLPAIFVDPAFAALALALVLAIFLLLDLFRASQLPPLSRPLTHFLAPYVDGRDHRGPVIVSHIFLLIGCAVPLWLALADTERSGAGRFEGWDVTTRDLSMVSGVICVGMGDAAASLIGRRYGRHRWLWSGGKSLEGSLAFALAVILGLGLARLWLLVGGWVGDSGDEWIVTFGKAAIAATGASFTEAVLTGGNDNVVVPIILWLLVRGLKM